MFQILLLLPSVLDIVHLSECMVLVKLFLHFNLMFALTYDDVEEREIYNTGDVETFDHKLNRG